MGVSIVKAGSSYYYFTCDLIFEFLHFLTVLFVSYLRMWQLTSFLPKNIVALQGSCEEVKHAAASWQF